MERSKFLIVMILLCAVAALSWGIDQAGAQVVIPQGAAGFNPAVNYNLPNYAYSPNIRKFIDSLPGLGAANANNLGQYIPIAVPDRTTYPGSDYYEIGLSQYQRQMHSDLPAAGTKLRGYYQKNGPDASKQYLGPAIIAKRDRPTRILFHNELPINSAGNLPLPVDTTLMGAGTGPLGGAGGFFRQNRATLHLHGGNTPWISDGTPHQWITPAGDATSYKKGSSFQNVPDMVAGGNCGANPSSACITPAAGDGRGTFYYTNQQSARLMFYHDHAYGITRLNVYAGMAAPYILTDDVEEDLLAGTNFSGGNPAKKQILPDLGGVYHYGIPLVIQDKAFVNDASTPPAPGFSGVQTSPTLAVDPLWANYVGTGGGNLWMAHEYMPNEDIYDPSGANPLGRSDYGPWLNPAVIPINATLPSPSITPEAWGDTMVVNGTAFPYLNVPASAVRFRILSVGNDRTLNLQWYVTDPAHPTEVKMVPAVPNPAFPTWPADGRNGGVPDPTTQGPPWILIGNEGGFLPQVAVIPAQPVAFEYSRLVPTILDVSYHSLLLMPAVRADVIVDFSAFAGKTLILYNDAPAPMPLFDERNDIYTGGPDMRSTGGAPSAIPGFGPNTRTVMQVRVASSPVSPPFDLAALQAALPKAYQASQAPPIVPQSAYNAAFGTANGDTYINNTDSTVNLTGAASTVAQVITTLGGSGYTSPPTVSFVSADGTGSGAAATAYLNGVTAITVTAGATPPVPPATTTATPYTLPPVVTITPDPLEPNPAAILPATAVSTISGGQVVAVTVVDPGANYTLNPLVTFTNAPGDTTGAGAAAVSGITLGAVAHITVTNPGLGYKKAPFVYLTGGGGTGATADAKLVGDTVIGMKNLTEGFEPWYGRINILLGTTPVPLDPLAPAPAVPGIAAFIDPPSDIWADGQNYVFRLAHLGVDSHAMHFHLVNLQVVNRVDYTNTMLPPEPDELGWKETIRTNPFTDVIVAVRPKSMLLPFVLPDSIRLLDETTPAGSTANYVQPAPTPGLPNPAGISNVLTNFSWEYVWHCHLLSHEENDMMRPIVFQPGASSTYVIPQAPTNVVATLGTGQVTVTFAAAPVAAGGGAVTGYTVKSHPPGLVDTNAGSTSLSHIMTGSQNNGAHYTFTVAATNAAGTGLSSDPSNSITAPLTLGHLVGVYRGGAWYFDTNGNGTWNGCGVDNCIASFGLPTDIPVMGDWNGTGTSKIGVFRNGQWYLDLNDNGAWDGCGTDACYASFGMAGDIPVAGDWDGTGTAKIGVFRNGQWFLDLNGNGLWEGCVADRCYNFGLAGDIPVVGDWNGTGTAKIGVFRNGQWFLDLNGNGAWDGCGTDACYTSFGLPTDIPVVGDWNQNGRMKIGVFRNGQWFLDMNGNGTWDGCVSDACYASFGIAGDKPAIK
jgi:FtsP/CotA-like multicopper oxidase with cupredoxin domain